MPPLPLEREITYVISLILFLISTNPHCAFVICKCSTEGPGTAGYSGGGADNPNSGPDVPGADGGSNGGNGSDTKWFEGGQGSGTDIATIPLANIALR